MGVRCHIIAVGRSRPGPARELFKNYAARLFPPLTLVEVEEKRPFLDAQLKEREAELLLSQIPANAVLVVLDERGEGLSSKELARRIGIWRDQGRSDLFFLIGGAAGHGEAVKIRADLMLALGAMTWPHMLVRGLIAEQLYRVQQILAGHPYHRE